MTSEPRDTTTTTGTLVSATIHLAPDRVMTIEGETFVLVPLDQYRALLASENATSNPDTVR